MAGLGKKLVGLRKKLAGWVKSWQVELKVGRLRALRFDVGTLLKDERLWKFAILASCQGLAVCGYVGRFKKSKLHNDMIVKSDITKTKNLL